jgi:hypothetical protein
MYIARLGLFLEFPNPMDSRTQFLSLFMPKFELVSGRQPKDSKIPTLITFIGGRFSINLQLENKEISRMYLTSSLIVI